MIRIEGHTFLARVRRLECEPDSEPIRFMFITFAHD